MCGSGSRSAKRLFRWRSKDLQLSRRHVTLGVVLAGVSLAGAVIYLKWREDRAFQNPALQLSRFPVDDAAGGAAVLSIDFALLRRGGLLTASKTSLEPEYKQFLEGTGFDYRRDLDQLTASFSKTGNYFLARGRFDWPKLHDYVRSQGGSCYEQLCRMPGSKPERRISFLPLRDDFMALAVSSDDLAATRLSKTGQPVNAPLPASPAWLSLPGAALRQPGLIPPGMHVMLSALTTADRVLVTLSPETGGIEARLEASCRTKDDAGVLTSQLQNTAGLVREGIANKTVSPPLNRPATVCPADGPWRRAFSTA
jgi:hypothetical protein